MTVPLITNFDQKAANAFWDVMNGTITFGSGSGTPNAFWDVSRGVVTLVSDVSPDAPGAFWDTGLQWDVNIGPSLGDAASYLGLITSEHNTRPQFMEMVRQTVQPLADIVAAARSIPSLFDLDVAVGNQEDILGQWIGVGRNIQVPLTGVFFSFDTNGQGFDQGTWWTTFVPTGGLVQLPDDSYRTLLRARIAADSWDGTISSAYRIWDNLFGTTGKPVSQGPDILIQNTAAPMHVVMALTGAVPDAVTLALFTGNYISFKPAGVRIDTFMTPSIPHVPFFGFDVNNDAISGFDLGGWGKCAPGA